MSKKASKKTTAKPAEADSKTEAREVRALMRRHGVTTTLFKDKRALACDTPDQLPAAARKRISEALKAGII